MADFWGDIGSALEGILGAIPGVGPVVQAFVPPPPAPATANVNTALTANPALANLGNTGPGVVAAPGTQVANNGPSAPLTIPQDIGTLVKALISGSGATNVTNLLQAVQRYQLQRNLQDPNWVANQVNKLNTGLSKPLRTRLMNETEANMAGQGLGQAPGLVRQATQEALAPYQYKAQQNAIQEFLTSIGLAADEYPLGGPDGEFSNFLNKIELGQSQGSDATPTDSFGP